MKHVCRTCLQYVDRIYTKRSQTTAIECVMRSLVSFVPELNLDLTTGDPGICFECLRKLHVATMFRRTCLENERLLRVYRDLHSLRQVNLKAFKLYDLAKEKPNTVVVETPPPPPLKESFIEVVVATPPTPTVAVCRRPFIISTPTVTNKVAQIEEVFYDEDDDKLIDNATYFDDLEQQSDPLAPLIGDIPEIHDEFDVPEYVSVSSSSKVVMVDGGGDSVVPMDVEAVDAALGTVRSECRRNVNAHGDYIDDHDYTGITCVAKGSAICSQLAADDRDDRYCHICERMQSRAIPGHFDDHMRQHERIRPIFCRFCWQQFDGARELNGHLVVHRTICDVCGSDIPMTCVALHQAVNRLMMTTSKIADEVTATMEPVYFCVFCMLPYRTQVHYKRHLSTDCRRNRLFKTTTKMAATKVKKYVYNTKNEII